MLQISWNTLWGICSSHIAHKTPCPQFKIIWEKNIQSKIQTLKDATVMVYLFTFFSHSPLFESTSIIESRMRILRSTKLCVSLIQGLSALRLSVWTVEGTSLKKEKNKITSRSADESQMLQQHTHTQSGVCTLTVCLYLVTVVLLHNTAVPSPPPHPHLHVRLPLFVPHCSLRISGFGCPPPLETNSKFIYLVFPHDSINHTNVQPWINNS